MANIVPQLQKILTATYGEEVRGAIYDSLAAVSSESSQAASDASAAKAAAKASASEAAESAKLAQEVAGNIDGLLDADLSGINDRLTKAEESNKTLEKRVGTLETNVDRFDVNFEQTIEDKVTSAVTEATTEFEMQIEGISQRVTQTEENSSGFSERITELETSIEGVDARIESTVSDSVSGAIEQAKSELKVATDSIKQDVSNLKATASDLEERTGSLETSVSGVEARVERTITDKITGAVNQAKADWQIQADSISQRVSNNQGQLTELSEKVDSIDATVERTVEDKLTGEMEKAKAELSAKVNELDSSIEAKVQSSVEEKVPGVVESATAGLEAKVEGMEASITAKVQEQMEDTVTGAVSEATADLELRAGEISQRVESLEETSEGLETRAAEIETKVDGIKLEVTQSAGADGKVTAKITLSVGPNSYSGFIKMDGNLQVSGQLSADALYSALGDIADLKVDKLSTSRKIVLHLAKDTSDDNYVRIHEQFIEFVTDSTDGTEEQAVNPSGLPIYWESDPDGADIGSDGYPYRDGQRIFITTKTTTWPVKVYKYTSYVKRSIGFTMIDGDYTPVDVFGIGDEAGNNRTRLYKKNSGLELLHTASNGKKAGLTADNSGYLDLIGLRKTTGLDFTGWDTGTFTETADGDKTVRYTVTFDDQQRPVKITDDEGHVTTIAW